MTDSIQDLPWPRGSAITDEYDFERVPFEIKNAAAALHPDDRVELLDMLGPDPSLTTLCRFHDDGTVGVVMHGHEVLRVHAGRLAGIDMGRVRTYVDRALEQMPPEISGPVNEHRDQLTVEAPPDSDWVTVRWRTTPLAEMHRSNVVPGWPPKGSSHE